MICENCKHYNRDNAVICRYCGTRLIDDFPKAEDFFPQVKKNNVFPSLSQPKSKTFSDEDTASFRRNAPRGSDSDTSVNRTEKPVSESQEALSPKEKTAVFQERRFNKKFTSTLVFLTLMVLVCVLAFSYFFIGKYNSLISARYSAIPAATPTVTASPAPSPTPIPTTKPES